MSRVLIVTRLRFSEGDGNTVVRIQASVDIQAEPAAVFALVTDVARKARLDPNASALAVGQETEGPVDVGTVFHYRIAIEGKIADYRTRCVAFEAGRVMETVSDSNPPFRIRVAVEPIPGGARLTQEESFSLPVLRVPLPRASGWPGKLLRFVFGKEDFIVQKPGERSRGGG